MSEEASWLGVRTETLRRRWWGTTVGIPATQGDPTPALARIAEGLAGEAGMRVQRMTWTAREVRVWPPYGAEQRYALHMAVLPDRPGAVYPDDWREHATVVVYYPDWDEKPLGL